jgi:alanyl-tRNA synthetase
MRPIGFVSVMVKMDANQLRQAWVDYFVERGHHYQPSASLVSKDPTVMFTVAGMVPLKPYYLGEEVAPHPRLTSIQRCVRVRGKHDDIDVVGTDTRHLTFFEMLGNFSLGDYFKAEAITMAWEVLTEVLGLDGDRLWVTVHEDDDEAAAIWVDKVGLAPDRIQALGEDNLWAMGEVGPCGPDSEIFYDQGPAHGPGGGPAQGSDERYIELWNLVFMQYNRGPDGTQTELPQKNIDTGAGLERILPILAGTESVYDTDVLRPIVAVAESATGATYGAGGRTDVGLRILADHARAMTFLVSDGVTPANEARGYVLRRIIRRALRWGAQLGATGALGPSLVEAVVATMGPAYPELVEGADAIATVVAAEEERFGRTLRAGQGLLATELERAGGATLAGPVAFRLHDTYGFPIELTAEIAAEAGVEVDRAGFDQAMADQRARARSAAGRSPGAADTSAYRAMLAEAGPTVFTGYVETTSVATVVGVVEVGPGGRPEDEVAGPDEADDTTGPGGRPKDTTGPGGRPKDVELVLDRSPFYAEGGGQVGDTGTIATDTGTAVVTDTTYALPGLVAHRARVTSGHLDAGQIATATIDAPRREAIRRNHTGTHLLHWALREVLGPHVKQQGSLVAPDRLRFDFAHFAPLTPAQIEAVADLVNATILTDDAVEVTETSWAEAEALGAIAFFGDKYGDEVRVVRAGPGSIELCGGTHVDALGMIGPVQIVSQASIGSGTRRLEALTGLGSLDHIRDQERLLATAAGRLQTTPEGLTGALERLQAASAATREELKALRAASLRTEAVTLAGAAQAGLVVARRDDLGADQLKELALSTRGQDGVRAVVLAGTPDAKRVALVAAVRADSGLVAAELLAEPARIVGGGGGKGPELALAGGRDPGRIDEALALVRAHLGLT